MHFILVGGTGYLGAYLAKVLKHRGIKTTVASRKKPSKWAWSDNFRHITFDLNSTSSISSLSRYADEQEDKVVFIILAAIHHPDVVEENFTSAWHTNITQLSFLINALPKASDCIYISTDNVYEGGEKLYRFKEADKKAPVNAYGKQKLLAEQLMNSHGYNVVRCPFLIGPSVANKVHFYDHIVKAFSEGKTFELFSDSYRSSLTFRQAAHLIIDLELAMSGQYWESINLASDAAYSKYDVGLILADKLGVKEALVKPISIKSTNVFKAKRAESILMCNEKVKSLLGLNAIILEL